MKEPISLAHPVEGPEILAFEYLFAKQDRANINDDELVAFRDLAKAYALLTTMQMNQLLQNQDWTEICNGNQA